MNKIYLINGNVRESISHVVTANVRDSLDTDNWITMTLFGGDVFKVVKTTIIEYLGCYYEIISVDKYMNGYIPMVDVVAESVITQLNQSRYSALTSQTLSARDITELMTWALEGRALFGPTPFVFGTTDIIDTSFAGAYFNKGESRRALLYKIAASKHGEIEIAGWTINLLTHRGSTTPKELIEEFDVESVRFKTDYLENRTTYDIKLFRRGNLNVGDEVRIVFKSLSLDIYTRIIAIEYNPYNDREVTIEVGARAPGIEDFILAQNTSPETESAMAMIIDGEEESENDQTIERDTQHDSDNKQ